MAVYALRAFFRANGYKGPRALELETYHVPRRFRTRPEYVPAKLETYRMADCAGSLRDRAMVLLLYTSGLRNSTMRALLVGDIMDELEEGLPIIRIPVYVEMKQWIPSACKGGIVYYSFIAEEASQALRLYLADRKLRYGSIERNEPLFISEFNKLTPEQRRMKFLTSREVQIDVKNAARSAGIARWEGVHPHALRKGFETLLHSQLIDGSSMDVKVQEILMGHILPGSQDTYFNLGNPEALRLLYSKLNVSRPTTENKFNRLRLAVAQAFADTDVDPDELMAEYVAARRSSLSNQPTGRAGSVADGGGELGGGPGGAGA